MAASIIFEKHAHSEKLEPSGSGRDKTTKKIMSQQRDEAGGQPSQTIVWTRVILLATLHTAALYGLYILPQIKWKTWIWTLAVYVMSATGVTAGSHRLWAHRSYKARLPLRILLAVWNTMAAQKSIIEWSIDHRVHHKGSETDADPHNVKRGFFFAHCGWVMMTKHSEVESKENTLDTSDLYNDPVCAVQNKSFFVGVLILCYAFPALVPWYFWQESVCNAFFVSSILRYTLLLHMTWLVNSAAHMWGNRPYDKNINPAESLFVSFSTVGEGFHNYHHTFPHDYSASEFGWPYWFNFTTLFIDFMAFIGLAFDLRKMSPEAVARRMARTGDSSKAVYLLNPAKAGKLHNF